MTVTIIGRHVGHTATRFLMSDRGYVVATDDGRLVCINRECMSQRLTDCEHLQLVRECDRPDAIEASKW